MNWIFSFSLFIVIFSLSVAQPVQLNETTNVRKKRAPEFSPFNLQQFFQRNPSPLDKNGKNGVDELIKRGLNAINDLSKLSFTTGSPLANDTEKNRNTNSNIEINSGSVTDMLRNQIETIQTRLNSLAVEMGRFIQSITQSTTQFLPPFSQQIPSQKQSKPNQNMNLFNWLPNFS